MSDLSPTTIAMFSRRQFSSAHIFAENEINVFCGVCGRRRSNSDHVTREEDKAEVMRWRDRVIAARAKE